MNKEFNNENEQNFNCYYSLKPKYNTDYEILNIFVSWRQQDKILEDKKEQFRFKKNNNFLFNKNNSNNLNNSNKMAIVEKKEMIPKGFSLTHVKRNNCI